MKTTIEVNGHEIIIEEKDGVISVSALKDGDIIEEFEITSDESASADGEAFGGEEEVQDFEEFEEEDEDENDSMMMGGKMEEEEEEEEDENDEFEEEEEEEDDQERKLESFNSFLKKRK